MIPLILLGARQEDHTVNEYAEQDQREVRGLRGWAAGTGANISAYNDVTSILDRWTIDWLRLLIQPVFILSAGEGGHTMSQRSNASHICFLLGTFQHLAVHTEHMMATSAWPSMAHVWGFCSWDVRI